MGRLFGTDGVRGVANCELTCERTMEIGRAVATIITDGCVNKAPTFVVGSDTRASSDMLSCALSAGLCSVGANVINLGVVPTPAVAHLVLEYKADAGIMISASHNPAEFNGIKIFNSKGFKLADMLEEKIEEIVLDKVDVPKLSKGDRVGKIVYDNDAIKHYTDHIKNSIHGSLEGLKIAVDCANGSASTTAKILFEELGAQAVILNASPNGTNINENCGSTHIQNLAQAVVEYGCDCGVAFDGDADRCLCVDEAGNIIDGDMIMAVCAIDLLKQGRLNKNTVVGTILTNLGFTKFCEENGLRFIATKVGDRYVLEEMLLEDYSFGGEQSGHIIFREFSTTGDGQLTAIQLLSHLKSEGRKLSELASVMTKYPQIAINIEISSEGKLAFYTDKVIEEKISSAKEALGSNGRIVVRPSGTEPLIRIMAEGESFELINKVANEVADTIRRNLSSK